MKSKQVNEISYFYGNHQSESDMKPNNFVAKHDFNRAAVFADKKRKTKAIRGQKHKVSY